MCFSFLGLNLKVHHDVSDLLKFKVKFEKLSIKVTDKKQLKHENDRKNKMSWEIMM